MVPACEEYHEPVLHGSVANVYWPDVTNHITEHVLARWAHDMLLVCGLLPSDSLSKNANKRASVSATEAAPGSRARASAGPSRSACISTFCVSIRDRGLQLRTTIQRIVRLCKARRHREHAQPPLQRVHLARYCHRSLRVVLGRAVCQQANTETRPGALGCGMRSPERLVKPCTDASSRLTEKVSWGSTATACQSWSWSGSGCSLPYARTTRTSGHVRMRSSVLIASGVRARLNYVLHGVWTPLVTQALRTLLRTHSNSA